MKKITYWAKKKMYVKGKGSASQVSKKTYDRLKGAGKYSVFKRRTR